MNKRFSVWCATGTKTCKRLLPPRWPPLRAEIERRIKALEYKRDVARWGLEFVLYRDAQAARFWRL